MLVLNGVKPQMIAMDTLTLVMKLNVVNTQSK